MNRKEMIAATAAKTGRAVTDIGHVVDALEVVICEQVRSGEEVSWSGMMKIQPVTRAARNGVNPATQQRMTFAEKRTVKFTTFKDLKDAAESS